MTVVKAHIHPGVFRVVLHRSTLIPFILWDDRTLTEDWKHGLLLTSDFRAS